MQLYIWKKGRMFFYLSPTTNMEDGNRSAKGKAAAAVVFIDDENHGDFSSYNGGAHLLLTNYGGGSTSFSGGAGDVPRPQRVLGTDNLLFTGIVGGSSSSTQHHYELYHHSPTDIATANGGGAAFPSLNIGDDDGMHNSGRRPRSPPLPWSMEQIDSFIGNSLRSLTIHDDRSDDSRRLIGVVRGGRRQSSEFANNNQAGLQDLTGSSTGGGHQQNPPPGPGWNAAAADQYCVGIRRLEDVRGTMSSVARSSPAGCRFLVRMVAEGGAATALQVLDEVAGDVVGLMVHRDGHALVEALVQYLADEHIGGMLETLDAASPAQIVAVARSHRGSSILQTLISRIAGNNPGHAEFFTRTLARVGERGVLSLVQDMDGSRLIIKCLDTFSAAHNQFIAVAMAMYFHRVCRDRHGCHVMNRCIDTDMAGGGGGGGIDGQTWSTLVHAVCWDAFALAEHACGNYVVQQVIRCVPQARASLHAAFRGRYASLSTQVASSNVVQRCLERFSPEQADDIVRELLVGSHHWGCTFPELITDRFANYVVQTAMERTEIQMHNRLLDAIIVHSDEIRENMFGRNVYRKLCTLRRIYRPF